MSFKDEFVIILVGVLIMKILLATKNLGKVKEFKEMFDDLHIDFLSLNDLDPSFEVVETGLTYLENARIKAYKAYEAFHLPVIADDSGLEVEALNNLPGVFSHRFSGFTDDKKNMDYLLEKLKKESNRKANFVCTLVFFNGEQEIITTGKVEGKIIDNPKGNKGFGYDPIFFIEKLDKTFAELSEEEKNLLSHRGKAIKKLYSEIKKNENNSFFR